MEINSMNSVGITKRAKPEENNQGFFILESNKKIYSRNTIPSSVEYLKN